MTRSKSRAIVLGALMTVAMGLPTSARPAHAVTARGSVGTLRAPHTGGGHRARPGSRRPPDRLHRRPRPESPGRTAGPARRTTRPLVTALPALPRTRTVPAPVRTGRTTGRRGDGVATARRPARPHASTATGSTSGRAPAKPRGRSASRSSGTAPPTGANRSLRTRRRSSPARSRVTSPRSSA